MIGHCQEVGRQVLDKGGLGKLTITFQIPTPSFTGPGPAA